MVTPRGACAAKGKLVLVNSFRKVATRLPSGIAAATNPSAEDTVRAIEATLAADGPAARRARSASMAQETWQGRVREITRAIDELDLEVHARGRVEQEWRLTGATLRIAP